MEHKFNWTRLLITVLIVIITSAAIGGGVYYVLNSNLKDQRGASEKSERAMQAQIETLKKELEDKNSTENIDSATTIADPSNVVKDFADYYFSSRSASNSDQTYGYFTTSYANIIKQRYSEGAPADPIFGVQDYPTEYSAKTISNSNGNATVSFALGYSLPVTKTVSLKLVNKTWLIDNIK